MRRRSTSFVSRPTPTGGMLRGLSRCLFAVCAHAKNPPSCWSTHSWESGQTHQLLMVTSRPVSGVEQLCPEADIADVTRRSGRGRLAELMLQIVAEVAAVDDHVRLHHREDRVSGCQWLVRYPSVRVDRD